MDLNDEEADEAHEPAGGDGDAVTHDGSGAAKDDGQDEARE